MKGALPRLRGQMSRDGRVRLVKSREEATVAVDVRENTATLHVTLSRDAIAVNDYVSLRRPPAQ